MQQRIYPEARPFDELLVAGPVGRISYAQAQELSDFRPAKLGEQFGPLWATFWFRGKIVVPEHWDGKRVDLRWRAHSEALLWINGRAAQGFNHETGYPWCTRTDALLTGTATAGETIQFQIEMACNKLGGASNQHFPGSNTISPYVLDLAEAALVDREAWGLYYDFMVLQMLEAEQKSGLCAAWGGKLLSELNRFANIYNADDRSTWPAAAKILKALYRNRSAAYTHEVSAIGHAHLDTAWLWPYEETERKTERTFSTAVAYMDQYPEYTFSHSQAQQYAWLKRRNPDLYERVRRYVKEGRFCPVGGTWVEPDCNLPSGESLARQFLRGQRFFKSEFGSYCREFWNPDVFGYNGQIPQICRLSGITRFLTQKLSWNRFNKPAHHTFTWEGIDGSQVFTHFPPSGYGATVTVARLREHERDFKDHDRSQQSMMLYGFSDGGGGPTKDMVEILRRAKDIEGLPRTQMRNVNQFFDLLEKDNTDRIPIVGELFFECHQGTYTTQANTKRANRKGEFLLHDIEFLSAVAHAHRGADIPPVDEHRQKAHPATYPALELEKLWETLLLNQFHDVLPGTSIGLVYEEVEKLYEELLQKAAALRESALGRVAWMAPVQAAPPGPEGGFECLEGHKSVIRQPFVEGFIPVNTTAFERYEVAETPDGKLAYIEAPAYGIGVMTDAPDAVRVIRKGKDRIVLENGLLRAILAEDGTLVSLIEKFSNREALAGPGNRMLMYVDTPNEWPAWDIDPFHMEQEAACPPAHACEVIEENLLRGSVAFERKLGQSSSMRQVVRLAAGARRLEFHTQVEWHENQRMLKAVFPVNVRAMNATYEMQFGSVERPTHFNTSYDLAKYEVCGHKWADLSEYKFGVALLSESKYGFSIHGNVMRISLLRSAKEPDPKADMGRHEFEYAVMPHFGGWREAGVVAEAFRFNVPVLFSPMKELANTGPVRAAALCFFSVDDSNLVLDTVKKAEDSDALILRFYECHGARGIAHVRCNVPYARAAFCNILEEETGAAKITSNGIAIPYGPWKVITLRLE